MEHLALALALAATIRHGGQSGVADDLATLTGFAGWIRQRSDRLGEDVSHVDDEQTWHQVLDLRRALRSLFARAARPGPPSGADADRLLDPDIALRQVNAASAVARAPQLAWPEGGAPRVWHRTAAADPRTRLVAALASAAIDFLGSEEASRLRACPAPRCVRYFVREHPRQTWCKPSCGNRARVSRYYRRHRE
ncbi:CGNR zinc finger domain-containing protein [Amycolatopsis cihanbeyliensis]|uniref:CGNR zinc finger protein n=1 Tax=Amycolatopsis cihanbeyliensis TaxID=1128664 RepID=A0A542DG00_AMYCI|nr:ABATE domain-containing protein [Amycolatopsis cihanbeyliensis]TQJ01996.1 CGNR zinc finger protein [Amycolatopsis cihanbeyliensis]